MQGANLLHHHSPPHHNVLKLTQLPHRLRQVGPLEADGLQARIGLELKELHRAGQAGGQGRGHDRDREVSDGALMAV